MAQPIDPRIARALLEAAKANSEITGLLILMTQKLATMQGDSATATSLMEQQQNVQDAVSRQIKALNEALDA